MPKILNQALAVGTPVVLGAVSSASPGSAGIPPTDNMVLVQVQNPGTATFFLEMSPDGGVTWDNAAGLRTDDQVTWDSNGATGIVAPAGANRAWSVPIQGHNQVRVRPTAVTGAAKVTIESITCPPPANLIQPTTGAPAAAAPSLLAFPRNLIDGGDFLTNPWQRGTSFTGISNTVTYTADRWFAYGASTSSISVSQQAQTDVAGFADSLRWGRANTDTATIYLGQVLETLDCIRAQGQPVTVSFWAKAGAQFSGASLAVQLNHSVTAGNDTAAHLAAYSTNWLATPTIINTTLVPTTAPVRYSFTGTVPANATQLGLLFSYTPTGTNDSTDTIDFYGVQLEIGSTVSAFEHRDAEMELALCQRFCLALGGVTGIIGSGYSTSTTAAGFFIPFPTQMYAAPGAITLTTATDISVYDYTGASVHTISAAAFGSASVNSIHVTVTSSGLTTTTPYILYVSTAKVGNLVISCDL